MVMREHSANGLDAIISKQQYEYNYYLCSVLLDYSMAFYKAEKSKLSESDSILIKSWPESGSTFSGKISWVKSEKTILIKAELLKQNKIEFSIQADLSTDFKIIKLNFNT